jgi:hypothetical protein
MAKKSGVMGWKVWSVSEARRQQQLELPLPLRSVNPEKAEIRRLKRRRRRQAKQPGVYLP